MSNPLTTPPGQCGNGTWSWGILSAWLCSTLLLLLLATGCQTSPPQIIACDFSDPGWTVAKGQALWRPSRNSPSLAGELIVAKHTNGSVFIEFSKPPLSIVTATTTNDRWRIVYGQNQRAFSGHGRPPDRIVWFQLATPQTPVSKSAPWRTSDIGDGGIRTESAETGEALNTYLAP